MKLQELIAKYEGECDTLEDLIFAFGSYDEALEERDNQVYLQYTRDLVNAAITKIQQDLKDGGMDSESADRYIHGCLESFMEATID